MIENGSSPLTLPSSKIMTLDWKIKKLKNMKKAYFKGGYPHCSLSCEICN
jgi:hypothetical protein